MSRDQLRPIFRKAPKWVLVALQVASWPFYMTWVSFRIGFRDAQSAWWEEIQRIRSLEDKWGYTCP